MPTVAEHVVSPALFDSMDEYTELLKSGEVVPETSPLLSFTENAFAQFFENEVGREISGFDFKSKRRAARLRYSRREHLSKQALELISLYEQFCDVRADVLGAGYGGQASVLEDFHSRLVARLLERLRALAGARHDRELRERAERSLGKFEGAVDDHD